MKTLIALLLLVPLNLFSQDAELIPTECWREYKHENLPYPESEHCPLILCPDSSTICYLSEDNEVYTLQNGWLRIDTKQITIGEDGEKFYIILETDTELQVQSVRYPEFKIYLKK